ncbi:MAG: hypothetical protein Q7R84_01505 [bacterium]|nr:hypothetical protein [bacterium]
MTNRYLSVHSKKPPQRQTADFILSGKSGKGIILNVTDRKSRAPFLEQIIVVTVKKVYAAFRKIKKRFPKLRTITADNDLLLTR